MSWWIQQWKNFENPSTSAKVMGKSIEVPFLTHSVCDNRIELQFMFLMYTGASSMQRRKIRPRVRGTSQYNSEWKAVSKVVFEYTTCAKVISYEWHLSWRESCCSRELLSQSWQVVGRRTLVLHNGPRCALGVMWRSTVWSVELCCSRNFIYSHRCLTVANPVKFKMFIFLCYLAVL